MEVKILLILFAVMIFKCDGHLPILGGIISNARERVHSTVDGVAGALLGGISQGFNLNFGAHIGFNGQRNPSPPKEPDETIFVVVEEPNEDQHRPQNDNNYRPPYQDHGPPNNQRPQEPRPGYDDQYQRPHQNEYDNRPDYNNQGNGNNNFGSNDQNRPPYDQGTNQVNQGNNNYGNYDGNGRPYDQGNNQGNNNNGNYDQNGRPYDQGNNQGNNNNGNYDGNGRPNDQGNHQGNNNNGNYDQNQRPYDQGNGNYNDNRYPDGQFNQDNRPQVHPENNNVYQNGEPTYNGESNNQPTQYPSTEYFKTTDPSLPSSTPKDDDTEKPSDDLPLFVPLNPDEYVYGGDTINITAPKRDTENTKPADADEDFPIDVRFKNE